jgi:hypothetical protein
VNHKRLLKLADFLETVPRKRFDFTKWVGLDWKGKADLSCGTSACAIGWATTIPSFRKLGLKLSLNDAGGTPVFNGDFGSDAVAHFFDISILDAEFLFFPLYNDLGDKATPKQVAKHIREFVAQETKP